MGKLHISKCGVNWSSMLSGAHLLTCTNCQSAQLTLCHQLMLISGSRGRQLFGQLASAIDHCPLEWCYERSRRPLPDNLFFFHVNWSVGWVGVLQCRTGNSRQSSDHHLPLETIVLIMARCFVMTVTNWCWQIQQWRNASTWRSVNTLKSKTRQLAIVCAKALWESEHSMPTKQQKQFIEHKNKVDREFPKNRILVINSTGNERQKAPTYCLFQ